MGEDKLNQIFNIGDVKNEVDRLSVATSVEFNPDNIKQIYTSLSHLISSGQTIFDTLQALIESSSVPDPDLIASASAMMNSIKDALKEFTKIHMHYVKFEQMKEFEKMKMKERRKLLKYKVKETRKLIEDKRGSSAKDITNMVSYCQEDVINAIVKSEKETLQIEAEKK